MSLLNVHAHGPADGRPVLALQGVTGHCLRWRLPAVTDVLDTLDHLGPDRLPVIGHPFGGLVTVQERPAEVAATIRDLQA